MSGVFFTASRYRKTVLSTKVGCLDEYLNPVADFVFICEPNVVSISKEIKNIVKNCNKEKLFSIGNEFSNRIQELYNWNSIVKNLVKNCYENNKEID